VLLDLENWGCPSTLLGNQHEDTTLPVPLFFLNSHFTNADDNFYMFKKLEKLFVCDISYLALKVEYVGQEIFCHF